MELKEILVNKLIEKQYKIATAESCTGGLLAASIVDVANASKVLDMSFVTYSNESKIELLGVSENLIKEFGVVSEEVALKMAYGVSKKANANVGVGISGIAGPTGGTKDKPVGLMYSTIYTSQKHQTYKIQVDSSLPRIKIKEEFVKEVLKNIYEFLD